TRSKRDWSSDVCSSDLKDWEIKQARGIFESNIKEIDRKYRELGQALIEDQKEVVRKEKTHTPSQFVKDKVDGLIADTNFYFVTARNESEKKAAINELSESMEHLSNAEKLYMRRQIPQLMDMVKDSEAPTKGAVRGIAEKLKEAKTEEEAALELLEREVASGPLAEYRIKQIAEQAAEQSRQEWEGLGDTLHDKRFE